jgi:hypothetical protein
VGLGQPYPRLVTPAAVLLAVLLLVSGCAPRPGPPRPAETSMVALVGLFPDTVATRAGVVVNDELRAAAVIGAGRAALVDRAGLDPAPITGAGADGARWSLEIGFDFDLVDADGRVEGGSLQVLIGRFGAVGAAVRNDPVWRSLRVHHSYRGYGYDAWLNDGDFDLSRMTPVRPLGEAARLAVRANQLTWTDTTAAMRAALDARAGRGRLGDVPAEASLARAADDLGLYAAVLTIHPGFKVGPEPRLMPALGVAIGEGYDRAGPFLGVVLLEADQRAAAANAARLRRVVADGHSVLSGRPWREVFSSADVAVSGAVVSARLRSHDVHLWSALVKSGDSLLAGVSQ